MKKNDFIINNKVVYNKYKGTVYNLSNDNLSVTLQNPASQCFAILIEKQPEIVNQDYFFYNVWEKNGLPVNVNTFYQSISLIRKALKTVGLDEDIIKTTPRLGISIPEYVDIVHIKNEDKEENIKAEQVSANIIAKDIENIKSDLENNSQSLTVDLTTDNGNKEYALIPWWHKYIISLFIIIISASLTYCASSFFDKGSSSEYQFYGKYQNCDIYTQNDFTSLDYIITLINKLEISCDVNSKLYHSSVRGVYVDNLFHCKDKVCVSYYYLDERKRADEKN